VGTGLSSLLNTMLGSDAPVSSGSGLDARYSVTDGSGAPLPNANDRLTPAPGTRLEYTPVAQHYRIDIVSGAVPELDAATYTLPITGLVANEVNWTLDDIRAMPSTTEFITMSCISNRVGGSLISTTKWTGVSMQYLLDQVKPSANAKAIMITSADGFDEFIDLDLIRQDERIMLVYAWDDQPLPSRNGFPLRTHIPDRYGMKQPKWITGMEFVEAWEEGYWVRRGWSRDAIVRATSVIDTVATEAIYDERGASYVPIGGMAWAGARGISQVQIRVDNGDWQVAEMRGAMSDRAWNLWRYDWAFSEGNHLFEVRCVETDGTSQIDYRADVRPDGATGIFSVRETVQKA
jgi:DMSO/TMAO reductase YedYZ molybdopterin-dependent catalytic subunit